MIILLNKDKKELNYYNNTGDLIESIPIDNYRDGLTLMSLKDDVPISNKSSSFGNSESLGNPTNQLFFTKLNDTHLSKSLFQASNLCL